MAQAHGLWPETALTAEVAAGVVPAPAAGRDSGIWVPAWLLATEERSATDLSWLGLLLCFASASLTLVGIGAALERIFS